MTETSRLGPPRDRRQSKRFLTASNFRRAIVVAAIVFTGVSVYSELRAPDHGNRLYERRTIAATETAREAPAIAEEPVVEAPPPDPLLIDSIQRERILGVEEAEDLQIVSPSVADAVGQTTTSEPILGWARPGERKQKATVGIEGGAGGLRVVKR